MLNDLREEEDLLSETDSSLATATATATGMATGWTAAGPKSPRSSWWDPLFGGGNGVGHADDRVVRPHAPANNEKGSDPPVSDGGGGGGGGGGDGKGGALAFFPSLLSSDGKGGNDLLSLCSGMRLS